VRAECFQQTVEYLPKNVLRFFSLESDPGSLVPVDGMMNSSEYIEILKNKVLPFLKTFADGKGKFQHNCVVCNN
jgi:hypothetical protein